MYIPLFSLVQLGYPAITNIAVNQTIRYNGIFATTKSIVPYDCRVVSRFLSRRFHPKSRRLFPFYFSNITLRTDLLTFRVTGAVFKIAGEMRRLPAYFDNPVNEPITKKMRTEAGMRMFGGQSAPGRSTFVL